MARHIMHQCDQILENYPYWCTYNNYSLPYHGIDNIKRPISNISVIIPVIQNIFSLLESRITAF